MMNDAHLDVLIEGYDANKALKMEEDISEKAWREIYSSRQNSTILQADVIGLEDKIYSDKVKEKKPCAIIQIGFIRGFVPIDFSGVQTKDELRDLVGTAIAFKVIAIDRENEIFVASRDAALEHMANITIKKLKKDKIVLSVIRKVGQRDLQVDIGGIKAEIPITEVDYGWVDNLEERYKAGDHINVKIIEVDKDNKQVKVSAKAAKPNHWSQISKQFSVKSEYVGKVSGVTDYGTFVNLAAGVDALVPHLRHESVKKGQKVLIRISSINAEEQKINGRIIRIVG
ncbi:S1 RNA-binding domain-containing protein [Cytobacillus sp. IB215665]|uniref:S1 RNA-binding domain-containing protein n=1 Tax=Cytobacillus sp. IB215665 TaxID=3097357 RepID=UPI002A15BE9A|nr:S1 RNA-binding domain-containing protein [Cytobacillus sp. IB215665]MDX8367670.1 S1 RNA-binding domain-containing protein [Cytobacillus sp. IB215665]